ncbi:hypothetical protein Purlil1_7203 [Purpureocillium lilacinum]|uniref:Uncharacterized protein n=1 Tax=Purpureocillium lilacinum TaxID=33203 RepID=A0ABR0BWA1_PURLI|nr:hypothetical protein Purlil1_7203 [Purpureocillium lilacinum]
MTPSSIPSSSSCCKSAQTGHAHDKPPQGRRNFRDDGLSPPPLSPPGKAPSGIFSPQPSVRTAAGKHICQGPHPLLRPWALGEPLKPRLRTPNRVRPAYEIPVLGRHGPDIDIDPRACTCIGALCHVTATIACTALPRTLVGGGGIWYQNVVSIVRQKNRSLKRTVRHLVMSRQLLSIALSACCSSLLLQRFHSMTNRYGAFRANVFMTVSRTIREAKSARRCRAGRASDDDNPLTP